MLLNVTGGQKYLHDKLESTYRECKTPIETFAKTLETNLEATVPSEAIRDKKINHDLFTTTGHNLKKENERRVILLCI